MVREQKGRTYGQIYFQATLSAVNGKKRACCFTSLGANQRGRFPGMLHLAFVRVL